MNKNITTLCILGVSLSLLTACVSRTQADQKLAQECKTNLNIALPEDRKLNDIAKTEFSNFADQSGSNKRQVKLITLEKDGFLDIEKAYECVFEENFAAFNMNHTAELYQMRIDDIIADKNTVNVVGDSLEAQKLKDLLQGSAY